MLYKLITKWKLPLKGLVIAAQETPLKGAGP
jgi:hypothetical protein